MAIAIVVRLYTTKRNQLIINIYLKPNTMKTIENNILIAKFLGFDLQRYEDDGVVEGYKLPYEQMKSTFSEDELKFNTSWDWLMPVVSKCYEYGELDNTQREQIIASLSGIIDIEDTHNAVVDFIKWYNIKKTKDNWTVTDEDCNQMRLDISPDTFLFKEDRVIDPESGETEVYESEIDLKNYTQDQMFDRVRHFGYSFNEMCSWIDEGENLSLIAECIFEMED